MADRQTIARQLYVLHHTRQQRSALSRAYRGQHSRCQSSVTISDPGSIACYSANRRIDSALRSSTICEPNASGIVRLSGCRAWCPAFDDTPRSGLPRTSVANITAFPTRRPPVQVSSTSDAGSWAVTNQLSRFRPPPCPRGACGEFESRLVGANSSSSADQAARADQAGRLTGDVGERGPEPDVQIWSVAAPSLFPPSARVLAALAARRTPRRFSKWNGSPAVPQCG